MNKFLTLFSSAILLSVFSVYAKDDIKTVGTDGRSVQELMFDDGNYAMFIHFGLYSQLEGVWKDKTYFGNAEWIMNSNQAGISVEEYSSLAHLFNPVGFDADAIVKLAKDAGMKYIIITAKHHEGFAMFDSDASEFNIHDATPLKRDLMAELADACHRNGLGIGFYYSQFQDWTAPGGGGGPKTDSNGREVSFDEYFREKCVPQVKELLTKYGEIELIWFDTPGSMQAHYSEELVNLVHELQPGALVSSRVGNGMGDYETLGDMEAPLKNIDRRWEGIDVTQVGWGYSRNDSEWKSPSFIVRSLITTVARGGTFMLNVGPSSQGLIAPQAQFALTNAGRWIKKYPETVYAAGPSPWGHALPWGDAVTRDGKIYLVVYDWPSDGKLWVPGVKSDVRKARLYGGKKLKCQKDGPWLCLNVPFRNPDMLASVIELDIEGEIDVDGQLALDPSVASELSTVFAETGSCNLAKQSWMDKFGEWKFKHRVKDLRTGSYMTWNIEVKEAGWYDVDVEIKSDAFVNLQLDVDGKPALLDKQKSAGSYAWKRLGWVKFDRPGVHTVSLKSLQEAPEANIASLRFNPVKAVE